MKIGEQPEELNSSEKQNIVTGKELEGRVMAGVGTPDLEIYKEYLEKEGIKHKIYTYKDKPELSLIVFGTPAEQRRVFDGLVKDNENIKGGFWSDSTVEEETELELVSINNKAELNKEFKEGDIVELVPEKIEQLKKVDLLVGFPHTSGEISSISDDVATVDFGGSVRLVNLKDIEKM